MILTRRCMQGRGKLGTLPSLERPEYGLERPEYGLQRPEYGLQRLPLILA